ncbi:hypothetical protein BV22DRAFT_1103987 [Leucogyrophana mollusca]|uniref:Uncharacterized protein n=1 Tax=Leucogyrophana mollusca TaxID=85980 RepID=A0ACB8BNB5_9AGAM|nr:hypothetical protein BV22DRAFT_1103987 [Leucogyrophana mollusca]
MVHVRKSNRKVSGSRARSSTPMHSKSMIKQAVGPTAHSKRQRQKQEHFKRERRRVAFATQRVRRERWASIARDTQRIVLGDGNGSSSSLPFDGLAPIQHHPQGPPTVPVQIVHDISPQVVLSKQGTTFYPHCSPALADWRRLEAINVRPLSTKISFASTSTLTAARRLHKDNPGLSTDPSRSLPTTSIGALSFASPKRPGGGFLHGGNEQEEVFARSSSLLASLQNDPAKEFYKTHRKFLSLDGAGIHDHSMVYSPGVVVFRKDDDDDTPTGHTSTHPDASSSDFITPYIVNVLSAVPVNAAAIRQNYLITPSDAHVFEDGIRDKMRDRMARALRIFEVRGDRALILGAFGCGSSENRVEMVAELWAELLVCEERDIGKEGTGPDAPVKTRRAKFRDVFQEVVFAVPGKLYEPFRKAFEMRLFESVLSNAASE